MGKLLTIIIMIMITTNIAMASPFGLTMGMSLKQVDPNAKEIAPSKFVTTKVPKPHSAFEQYVVQIGKRNGLCLIKAIGKDISTGSYGIELKSSFESMKAKLTKAYGKGETINLVMPGSLWTEPNYFMMGLIKKDRYLMTTWGKDEGSKLKDNLKEVALIADANGRSKGYLIIEYSFINHESCDKEIAAQEDAAL